MTSAGVALRVRMASRSASTATSWPTRERNLKQSAIVLATLNTGTGWPPMRISSTPAVNDADDMENTRIGGHPVPVFSVAKTIADCFKFRSRVGHDVAVEAL